MKLRVARHTANLDKIVSFYTNIIGLQVTGSFKNHSGYDGVFLSDQSADWQLEFTCSDELPEHQSDEDDLLVFYKKSEEEYRAFIELLKQKNIEEVKPKNPYWAQNGFTFPDPDGYLIVISFSK